MKTVNILIDLGSFFVAFANKVKYRNETVARDYISPGREAVQHIMTASALPLTIQYVTDEAGRFMPHM